MGDRPGPIPKRDDQRRRRNPPAGGPAEKGEHIPPRVPVTHQDWHPIAKHWFESLAASGQSWWYQQSDWATAELLAEEIHRCLSDQVVGITKDGEPILGRKPVGASLAGILKGASVLMATEGDRRRLRIELERRERPDDGATVSWLAQARRAD